MLTTDQAFDAFTRTLEHDGLRAALVYLVGLTDYRFIGIWQFNNGKASAIVYFDKENPDELTATETPDTAVYCCYARDSGGVFTTANAMLDSRAESHAARDALATYCSVPVMDAEGTLLGTLCHYDVVPRDPSRIDQELLLQVASMLAYRRLVPPYSTPSAGL